MIISSLMMSTDSVVVQGCSPDREPVTVITSEKVRNDTICQVFSLDFETNPLMVRADSALAITTEPIDITYHEVSAILDIEMRVGKVEWGRVIKSIKYSIVIIMAISKALVSASNTHGTSLHNRQVKLFTSFIAIFSYPYFLRKVFLIPLTRYTIL